MQIMPVSSSQLSEALLTMQVISIPFIRPMACGKSFPSGATGCNELLALTMRSIQSKGTEVIKRSKGTEVIKRH